MRLLIGVILALALPAQAQVYKCKDSAGKMAYQDAPCDGGKQLVPKRSEAELRASTRAGAESLERDKQYLDELADRRAAEAYAKQEAQGKRREQAIQNARTQLQQQQTQMMNQPPLQLNKPKAPTYSCRNNAFGGMDCSPRPY